MRLVCVCVLATDSQQERIRTDFGVFWFEGEVRPADDSGSFGEGGSGRLRTRGGVAVRRGLSPVISQL